VNSLSNTAASLTIESLAAYVTDRPAADSGRTGAHRGPCGEPRASPDMVVQHVMSPYGVTRKQQAGQHQGQRLSSTAQAHSIGGPTPWRPPGEPSRESRGRSNGPVSGGAALPGAAARGACGCPRAGARTVNRAACA
jgi:hypothetical protein